VKDEHRALLAKQHYNIVGEHSGVKLCHWMRQKLYYGRICYKEQFYGIECHRCLQMTPVLDDCTQQCVFCWRHPGFEEKSRTLWDEPDKLLDNLISGQRMLVSGFKGDERCNLNLWKEAQNPTQVAISLTGEPTIYPYLSDFITLCHRKGMTTFLVTNGTNPTVLSKMDTLPTQLYVTVAAPNEQVYKSVCKPMISDGWKRIMETLSLMPSLNGRTRTVIRHTLAEGLNLGWEDEYGMLDSLATPDFIECKGYMLLGHSRRTLTIANMPRHERIMKFATKVAEITGYRIEGEKADSRVAVLSNGKKKIKIESS
jgi:tRNA wybutosine-synthesizing protein 1